MPSYRSFSGGDITATFGDRVIGELLSLTYSVTREKGPIYTMGSDNPRGFSRGRRGIAGSLVFAVFDRNAFLSEMRKRDDEYAPENQKARFTTYKVQKNGERIPADGAGAPDDIWQPENYNDYMSRAANNGDLLENTASVGPEDVQYADQVMPFDVTVNFLNEYGEKARLTLYGCEILNQGMGVSVDDLATSQNYTFIARDLDELEQVDGQGNTIQTDNGSSDDVTEYGR